MSDAFQRMAFEVSRFLSQLDLKTRLSGMATLYLEFPDVSSMRGAEVAIYQEIGSQHMNIHEPLIEFIDDHTMRVQPYAGVSIVLSCKQRFATKTRGSVGYRDIAFKTAPQLKK